MSDELARHKEALKVAIGALRELGLDYAHFTETVEKRVAAVLEPAPEFEEVEVIRWECGCGHVHKTAASPKICDGASGDGWCNSKGPFTKLTGTVKRPVKRSVVREVKVYMTSVDWEDTVARCFMDHPDIHGEHGELIFRCTD